MAHRFPVRDAEFEILLKLLFKIILNTFLVNVFE